MVYGAQHVSPIAGLYIQLPLRRQPRLINSSYVRGASACATAPSDTLLARWLDDDEGDGGEDAQYPHRVAERP